ncbi:hypothetical protein, partial [Xanthovirga aplysinae]|uniref:hypothetical protein n=1 Tax=Xanthovirga aplysinae TaxID=2529853 RepID=UPI001CA45B41
EAVAIRAAYVNIALVRCWGFAMQEGGQRLVSEGTGLAWLLGGVALSCTLESRVGFVGCR